MYYYYFFDPCTQFPGKKNYAMQRQNTKTSSNGLYSSSSSSLLLLLLYSVPCVLQNSVQLVSQVLESFLKISVLIGLVFITFGYSYSFLLLSIYGGPVLTDGSGRVFCFVFLFLLLPVCIAALLY